MKLKVFGIVFAFLLLFPLSSVSATGTSCTDADVNSDGIVDLRDYSILVSNFFTSPPGDERADINDDGIVDLRDYSLLVSQFFQTCPTPTPTDVPQNTAQPPDCSGYPEPRVFLESQAWWWVRDPATQSGDDFGHIHLGTCFPHRQEVSGVMDFDVRLIMHHNPGYIHHLTVDVWDDAPDLCYGGSVSCENFNSQRDGSKCDEGSDTSECGLVCSEGTCSWWVPITVDTTVLPTDGRKEFRFRAHQEQPDLNRLFESTGWQAYINNGKSTNDYRDRDFIEARGWYTGAEYTTTRIERMNIDPDDPYSMVGKVSGVWRPVIDIKKGSGGETTDHHIVMIDPAFHASPPSEGVVVKEGLGELDNYELEIDTTQLTNGWHRLALRGDNDFFDDTGECAQNKGSACDSTISNLLVIWFEVEN